VEKVLQSNRQLLLTQWNLEFTLIPNPHGHGKRKCFYNAHIQQVAKKSIVQIQNNDELCLWRAITVVKAFQDKKEKKITLNQYKVIASSSKVKQETMARELKEATMTKNGDLDDIRTISQYLKVNITVVCPDIRDNILFRTADSGDPRDVHETTLYLLKVVEHFDAINSITGFFGCIYYCDRCNS
jgi:hypothetical protein